MNDCEDWRPADPRLVNELRASFQDASLTDWAVCVFDSIPSTMNAAAAFLREEQRGNVLAKYLSFSTAAEGEDPLRAAIFSLSQSKGRGRMGRLWSSEKGNGVYASYALFPDRPGVSVSGLSLIVGLGVLRALERFGASLKLKWPNDILAQSKSSEWRKIAGVLVDLTATGECVAICLGVGVNLRTPPIEDAVGLDEAGAEKVEYSKVAVAMTEEVISAIEDFFELGFSHFCEALEKVSFERGKTVTITGNGTDCTGKVVGLSREGALRLETDTGEQLVYSGTLRVHS